MYPDLVTNHLISRADRSSAAAATYNAQCAGDAEKELVAACGADGAKLDAGSLAAAHQKLSAALDKRTRGWTGRRDLAKLSPWMADYSAAAGPGSATPASPVFCQHHSCRHPAAMTHRIAGSQRRGVGEHLWLCQMF